MAHENQTNKSANSANKVSFFKRPWVQSVGSIVVIFGLLAFFLYYQATKYTVSVENSFIEAPIVNISPIAPGILNAIYVKEGDRVTANSQLALVGSDILYTKDAGIISSAPKAPGSYFNPGQTVVSMIVDKEMKVVGSIDENKGLKDIKSGQSATFTVDAFPGKKYVGIVDSVSPSSSDTGVIFSISDKRPIKKFDVNIRFDVSKYPELKNGMSAKIKINTKG